MGQFYLDLRGTELLFDLLKGPLPMTRPK